MLHWALRRCTRPPHRRSLPRIRRKKSKLHGFGVFALEPINKNKRIIDYAGELISNKQSVNREDRYLRKGCIWVLPRQPRLEPRRQRRRQRRAVHQPLVQPELLGGGGGQDDLDSRRAERSEPGEELTYDYNTEGDKTIPCRCQPGCKNRL